MRTWLLSIAVLLSVTLVNASAGDDLKAGNIAYQDGKYEEAVGHYEKVISSGEVSWAAFFNLGNSYYKTGQLSKAILNYEKALRLNPTQEDVRFNLHLANQQIADRRPDYAETGLMGIWNAIERNFTADGWAVVSIIFFALILISLILVYIVPIATVKRILFGISFLWLFLGLMSVVFAQDIYAAYHSRQAIIMADAINVGSEPKETSTRLFILHSGTKVDILEESGDWYQVRFDPEKIGWVRKSDLAEIHFSR